MYQLRIRSRNGSAAALRRQILSPKRGVYRCGSFTTNSEIFTGEELRRGIIEINTVEASRLSNNKTEMKRRFNQWNVPSAEWMTIEEVIRCLDDEGVDLQFPWIIKHNHSSRGEGIYLMHDMDEFEEWLQDPNHRRNHIVEHYYTYVREYRLHVDKFGCFCANRKMLREDAEVRWHRHHSNSNWIREDNELFDRPTNWDEIVAAAQKARRSLGLDICSVDVKVQSSHRRNPLFFILETNSGSALGEQTTPLYIAELTRLAEEKSRGIQETFVLEDEDRSSSDNEVSNTPAETSNNTHSTEELSAEELRNVQAVENEVSDTPATITSVDTKAKEATTKKLKSKCPKDFEGCSHMIWTGENYGCCDITGKQCALFVIDTSIDYDDDDYDDDYDDDDENDNF